MQIYLFLIALSLYIYVVNKSLQNKRVEKILLFIFFFILFIVSGIRKHVGTDYGVYLHVYKGIDNSVYNPEGMEIGYFYLNKIVKFILGGDYSIFIVTSLIIIGLVYVTVKNFSLDPILSGIIFMSLAYLAGFNIIRQYIAISIVFYSIKYCETKIKWVIPLLIGALFHKTMLLVIPFYFIAKLNLSKKHYLLIGGIGGILYLTYGKTVAFLTNFIEGFEHYQGSKFVTEGANPIRTMISITILIFCLIGYEEIMNNKKMKFAFTMILFATILSLFMMRGKIFARVVGYFDIFQILLIPYVLKNINKFNLKKYSPIIAMLILGMNLFYFYYSVKTNQAGVNPYRTYINDLDVRESINKWFYTIE